MADPMDLTFLERGAIFCYSSTMLTPPRQEACPMCLMNGHLIGIVLISVALFSSGCTGAIRGQLDKMSYVNPPPELVRDNREWVKTHANYACPEGSTVVYVLSETELATNKTRAGIRCE